MTLFKEDEADRISMGGESHKTSTSDVSGGEEKSNAKGNPKKITLPLPLPTSPSTLKDWHFDLIDECVSQYPENRSRICKFLDKARGLPLDSNFLWTVPRDFLNLNASLITALKTGLRPNKELWERIEVDKRARRVSHANGENTITARKLLSHMYAYFGTLPEVLRYLASQKLMNARYEQFGPHKFVDFWRFWTEIDREEGGMMDEGGKKVRLLSILSKYRVMNDDLRDYDMKLKSEEQTYKN